MSGPGRCECSDATHAGNRKGACGAEIEPRHVKCRPCAMGNHARKVCATYRPATTAPHLDRRCIGPGGCGLDSALHPLPPELGGRV